MQILIADDHLLFREGMRHLLAELGPDVELLEAGNMQVALELARSHPALDLALLDLNLPDASGAAVAQAFRDAVPELPVIVLTSSEDPRDVEAVLDAGAAGYVPKTTSGQVMLGAIRLVLSGGIYIPPLLLNTVEPRAHAAPAPSPTTSTVGKPHSLTQRQVEVLRLVVEGKPNKLIARTLGLSEGTVKIHLAGIFRTLNVSNRTEAALAAQRLGILPSQS